MTLILLLNSPCFWVSFSLGAASVGAAICCDVQEEGAASVGMKICGDGEKEEEGEISSTTSTSDKGEDVLIKFQFN